MDHAGGCPAARGAVALLLLLSFIFVFVAEQATFGGGATACAASSFPSWVALADFFLRTDEPGDASLPQYSHIPRLDQKEK